MNKKKIKVIIADDHSLFADGLEQIILSLPDFEVIAKPTNGRLLLQMLNRLTPDLILLDMNMPYMDGLEAAKIIKTNNHQVKIIIISMYYDNKLINTFKNQNIDGYIIKDTTAPVLKETILEVLKGNPTFVLPESQKNKISPLVKDSFQEKFKLSVREIEIIKLIKEGHSSKQIASELELSVFTIDTHRKNIYRKLSVQGTAELISFAVKQNV